MRRIKWLVILAALTMGVCDVEAVLDWDSGHHVYSEGSENFVNMYNDASAEIGGGWIGEFSMHNDTTAEITGGDIDVVNTYNNPTLDMTGGGVEYIFGYDNSIINFFGGDVDILSGHNHSTFALKGGLIDTISILDFSHFNIYGSDFVWQRAGGEAVSGWLSGNWLNGASFNIYFRDIPEEFPSSHITLIPEPASIVFLGLGFWVVRKGTMS